jgi:hypothetical protein
MPSRPYKVVYGIRKTGQTDEEGQERERWTEIGVAFPNQDGSLNVILHYLPTNPDQTRIHIRDPRPREEPPPPTEEPPQPPSPPQPQQPSPRRQSPRRAKEQRGGEHVSAENP